MNRRYVKPMKAAEIAAVADRDLDFSDIPELDDALWKTACLAEPNRTRSVTLRIKQCVLDGYGRREKDSRLE